MAISKRVLVIGATGSIGRHVVALAGRCGYQVRAVVRNPERTQEFPAFVELIHGNITQAEVVRSALECVDCVVFTQGTYGDPSAAEQVDYGAVRNVLMGLQGTKVRLALMSTIGATDRKGSHDWKRRGERLVRASGLDYTIVRPGWFDYNSPTQHKLVMLQGDTRLTGTPRDGVIARKQVAEVLVRSLTSEAAKRKTVELHAEQGEPQESLEPLFEALDADQTTGLDGVHDVSNMPLEAEPEAIRRELDEVQHRFRRARNN